MKISKKLLRSPGVRNFLSRCVAGYIWFLYKTTSWIMIGVDHATEPKNPGSPSMYIFWHGRLCMMPTLFKDAAAMEVVVSQHNDGEYIARIVKCFGFDSIRGSTDRGSMQAARAIIKCLQSGKHVGISPDGPRGPRMRINSNLVAIAELTGAAIIPVTFSVSSCKIFPSWDRFMLPLPFSKGMIIFGKSIVVPKGLDQEKRDAMKKQVEAELNHITHEADRLAGIEPVMPDNGSARPKRRHSS